ncbi:S24 family peptidase [Ralstonia sp. L16]|uniref:S24 family peptidase n=1 Tax=Ralstonia sp. L16 TaxID=3423950 RepID=UPI003F791F12
MDIDEIRRENIRALEQIYGASALAEKAGMSLSQFYNLRDGARDSKTGKRRGMRKETAWKIEDAAGVERGYLDAVHSIEAEPRSPTDDEFALIPQLDIAAACGSGKFVDHVVVKGGLAFKRSSLRDFGVTEKTGRIIYASGGSMWPTIQDGRVVLINTADTTPRDGKVFAICTPDGSLVLKRLVLDYHPALGAQTWIMRSDNPDKTAHPDKVLPPDDRTMIAGRAVWNDNAL